MIGRKVFDADLIFQTIDYATNERKGSFGICFTENINKHDLKYKCDNSAFLISNATTDLQNGYFLWAVTFTPLKKGTFPVQILDKTGVICEVEFEVVSEDAVNAKLYSWIKSTVPTVFSNANATTQKQKLDAMKTYIQSNFSYGRLDLATCLERKELDCTAAAHLMWLTAKYIGIEGADCYIAWAPGEVGYHMVCYVTIDGTEYIYDATP